MKKGVGSGSGSISQRYGSGDPDPEPLVRGKDPGIQGSGSAPKCHGSPTLLNLHVFAKKLPNTRKFERLRKPLAGQWAMTIVSDPDGPGFNWLMDPESDWESKIVPKNKT
jgi:hypothetical protein